jgi:hypothetical protein
MLRYVRHLDALLEKTTGQTDPVERWKTFLVILVVIVAGPYWIPHGCPMPRVSEALLGLTVLRSPSL